MSAFSRKRYFEPKQVSVLSKIRLFLGLEIREKGVFLNM